jgi:hypothetical protein
MKLEIQNILNSDKTLVSEFTMSDFRDISFMIENDSDISLHDKLLANVTTNSKGVDVFNALMEARIKFIDDTVTFNNGVNNVGVNLDMWMSEFSIYITPIKSTLQISDDMCIGVDYPSSLYFNTTDDIMAGCVTSITAANKYISFLDLNHKDKLELINALPVQAIDKIKDFISKHNKNIILMPSRMNLPEMYVNFFDNSAFSLIKTVYSYYMYNDIIELLFILNKRISDMSYLTTRTPKELNLIIRLYEEEIEKLDQQDK